MSFYDSRAFLSDNRPSTLAMAEFDAREDALSFVVAHVEDHCARMGIAGDVGLRACLVIEELFLNAVQHGGAGDAADARVQVDLNLADAELEICFEDGGKAFNPFLELCEPLPDQQGGWGRWLVVKLTRRRQYQRKGERNCVRMWLTI
ncbi:MAG: ATP-binding protein [Panacagrimonas sp.]